MNINKDANIFIKLVEEGSDKLGRDGGVRPFSSLPGFPLEPNTFNLSRPPEELGRN